MLTHRVSLEMKESNNGWLPTLMRITLFWFCFHTNFVKAYLPPCKDIYSVGISPYYVECLAVEWMDQRWQEYETELWKGEENFSLWDKVKKLLRHLDQKFQCQPSKIFNRFLKYIRIFFQYLTIDNILSNRWTNVINFGYTEHNCIFFMRPPKIHVR